MLFYASHGTLFNQWFDSFLVLSLLVRCPWNCFLLASALVKGICKVFQSQSSHVLQLHFLYIFKKNSFEKRRVFSQFWNFRFRIFRANTDMRVACKKKICCDTHPQSTTLFLISPRTCFTSFSTPYYFCQFVSLCLFLLIVVLSASKPLFCEESQVHDATLLPATYHVHKYSPHVMVRLSAHMHKRCQGQNVWVSFNILRHINAMTMINRQICGDWQSMLVARCIIMEAYHPRTRSFEWRKPRSSSGALCSI